MTVTVTVSMVMAVTVSVVMTMTVSIIMPMTVRMIMLMAVVFIVSVSARRRSVVFVIVRGFFHVSIPYCAWRLLRAKVVLSDYSCN